MVRKLKDPNEEHNNNNGGGFDSEMKSILKSIIDNQRNLQERMEEIEKGESVKNKALLQMVNFLYDTDDKHMPELTRIPIPAARPFALGMALESIFDDDVQSGEVSLSKKVRINYFRLMRSVGGVHLGRGLRLAEDQAAAAAEESEEMDLGGD